MQPNGLPRFCRLHLKRDFKGIIQGGIKLQYKEVVMWCRVSQKKTNIPVRFAVVVSRKLGTAAVRNRAKRLLREAFRLNKKYILAGTDIIVSPRGCEMLGNVQAAQEALMTLIGKAELLSSSSTQKTI